MEQNGVNWRNCSQIELNTMSKIAFLAFYLNRWFCQLEKLKSWEIIETKRCLCQYFLIYPNKKQKKNTMIKFKKNTFKLYNYI